MHYSFSKVSFLPIYIHCLVAPHSYPSRYFKNVSTFGGGEKMKNMSILKVYLGFHPEQFNQSSWGSDPRACIFKNLPRWHSYVAEKRTESRQYSDEVTGMWGDEMLCPSLCRWEGSQAETPCLLIPALDCVFPTSLLWRCFLTTPTSYCGNELWFNLHIWNTFLFTKQFFRFFKIGRAGM